MIKTVNIKVNAGNVNYPLGPFYIYKNSAASLTITDVPKPLGVREVTGVTVKAKNADGTELGVAAVRNGSAWGATVPASHWTRSGTIAEGITIQASGKSDAGADATWILGVGQVYVIEASGTITPGEVRNEVDWYDLTPPATPKIGDMAKIDGVVRIYTRTGWMPIGGGSGDVKRADFAAVDALPAEFTENEMRAKLNTVISILKAGATTLLLSACCCLPFSAFSATVQTALKGDIKNTAPIVTNVTFEGLEPGNYAAVSNAAMTAVQPAALNDYLPTSWAVDPSSYFEGSCYSATMASSANTAEESTSSFVSFRLTKNISNIDLCCIYWDTEANRWITVDQNRRTDYLAYVSEIPSTNGFITAESDPIWSANSNNFATALLAVAERSAESKISATYPAFSNAVLAVGLNIDTNSVAVLNEIAASFGGFPLSAGETATTVGGLLAALAAAVAWLKKKSVKKDSNGYYFED